MSVESSKSRESVLTRTLWLYGLYSLINMLSFLGGYYLLPEGVMRGTPQSAIGSFVASATTFCGHHGGKHSD